MTHSEIENKKDHKVWLSPEQALSMLPEGDCIHTFRSSPQILLGADWPREDIEKEIRKKQCEVGGEKCQSINHGLVIWTSDDEPLFVECRKGIDYKSFEESQNENE